MTKAQVMLRALSAKRQLKEICSVIAISYKYTHAVARGTKIPSMDLMSKMREIIPVEYWFDVASKEFKDETQECLLAEDLENPAIIDFREVIDDWEDDDE